METYVVDASVGVKWFFNEDLSGIARNLLYRLEKQEIKLIVPEIFYIELGNVFWKRVRKKEITEQAASDAFDTLIDFSLKRYSDHELADVTLSNAMQYGVAAYDALYIALAEVYVVPLITADKVLLKACKGRFDFIQPLEVIEG